MSKAKIFIVKLFPVVLVLFPFKMIVVFEADVLFTMTVVFDVFDTVTVALLPLLGIPRIGMGIDMFP